MGLLSRRKGRSFEQRIAAELRDAFPSATVRRSLQAHRAFEPDVVIEGDASAALQNLWLELTDATAPNPTGKLEQAEGDALPGRLPVVVWHRIRERSVQATMRVDSLRQLLGDVAAFRAHPIAAVSRAEVTLDWPAFLDVVKVAS